MPLRVIDGTPTAISKFIREEEAMRKCPECGSEMERRASVYTLSVPERWVCKCGHEEKVKP